MRIQSTDNDPMTHNIIHWLLVTSNRMQAIPAVLVAVLIVGLSAVIDQTTTRTLALVYGVSCAVDWLQLWLLPQIERSFGPEKPPTLALAALKFVLVLPLGLISVSVAIGMCVALSVIAIYATWFEPFRLGVTHETYHTKRWRPTQTPLRLLHIGDLHMEHITVRERDLNRKIAALKPDIIVFSGDFVNISYVDDPLTHDDIRRIISAWQAPLGVYCVPGTYTVESLDHVKKFTAGLTNLRLLLDEWVDIETPGGILHLLGMVTTHRLDVDQAKVRDLSAQKVGSGLRLLLTHAPDVAPEADQAGFDLYLCGHTHGGQLRLPLIGAIFTGSHLGRRFVMGRYDLDNVTVYTSRGVGMEGMGAPRARFLCPPEIILWEIQGG